MTETEIKLSLDPRDAGRLRRSPALASVRPTRRRLRSIFLDTAGAELEAAGYALRLRRAAGRWMQAVKAGASGPGGLHRREEWEFPRPGPEVDLSLFAATPFARLPGVETLHERLLAVFTVEVEREAWVVEPAPGSRLEVVLDRGEIVSGERREAVCEVEVELLEGPVAAAFALAEALLDGARLRPCAVSKAERGYRLFHGAALRPEKARSVALDAAMSPPQAARAVVAGAMRHLEANEEGLLATRDPEFVHQLRVGLRRLRAAIRLFREVIGPARAARWNEGLAAVGRALGEARDWDVFATETLPPMVSAWGDRAFARSIAGRVQARRHRAREAARAAISAPDYARHLLDIGRWLATGDPAAGDAPPPEPLLDFASKCIRKRHRRLIADSAHVARLSPPERHRLRLDAKRLRYGVEGLGSLFKAKRVEDYTETLALLQGALGHANDAANAERLLAELAPPGDFRDFARGWLAASTRADLAALQAPVERLARTKRFWRRKPPGAEAV